jgi:hypothetical protein
MPLWTVTPLKTREVNDGSRTREGCRNAAAINKLLKAEAFGRKSRQQTEEVVRYFLAKEGSSVEKPELGVEVPSEGEALIKAFQSKNGVIYTLLAYKAEAEMQEGSPTLVKRPIRK